MQNVPFGIDKRLYAFLSEVRDELKSLRASLSECPFTFMTKQVPWNPTSISAGGSSTIAVPFAGVTTNDTALASLSSITTVGWQISAVILKPNSVGITITNETGGTVELGQGILRIDVFHKT